MIARVALPGPWRMPALGAALSLLLLAASAVVLAAAGVVVGAVGGLSFSMEVAALFLLLERVPVALVDPSYMSWGPLAGLLPLAVSLSLGGRVAARRAGNSGRARVGAGVRTALLVSAVTLILSLTLEKQVAPSASVLLGFLSSFTLNVAFAALGAVGWRQAWRVRLLTTPFESWGKPLWASARSLTLGLSILAVFAGLAAGYLALKNANATGPAFGLIGANGETALTALLWVPDMLAHALFFVMGASVEWRVTAVGSLAGSTNALGLGPVSLVAFAIPMTLAAIAGYTTTSSSNRSWRADVVRVAASFSVLCWLLAWLGPAELRVDAFLGLQMDIPLPYLLGLPALWGFVGGGLGVTLRRSTLCATSKVVSCFSRGRGSPSQDGLRRWWSLARFSLAP